MDVRFRAPKRSDDRQWKKVVFLVRHGFVFQKVYKQIGPGAYLRVRYPQTLEEARLFVQEYSDQARLP